MIRVNCNPDVGTELKTMYSVENAEWQNVEGEKKLLKLLEEGRRERVISDNVPRSKEFLKTKYLKIKYWIRKCISMWLLSMLRV